jgi:hypothetical protein
MNGVARKEAFEDEFRKWVVADPERVKKYGTILDEYASIYETYTHNYLVNTYTNEVFGSSGVEPATLAAAFRRAVEMAAKKDSGLDAELKRLQEYADGFFRNYDRNVSEKLFVAVMEHVLQEYRLNGSQMLQGTGCFMRGRFQISCGETV